MVLFVTNNINNIIAISCLKCRFLWFLFILFFMKWKIGESYFLQVILQVICCTAFYNKWNQRCVVQALVERRKEFVRHSTFHHGNTMTWTFFVESYYCGHTKVPTFFPSCFRLCRLNKKLYFKSKFQYLVKLSLVLYKKRVEKDEIAIIVK